MSQPRGEIETSRQHEMSEKTGLPTMSDITSLYNHRKGLEALNFGFK